MALIVAGAPVFTLHPIFMDSAAIGIFKTNLSLSAAATSGWRSNQSKSGYPTANKKLRFDKKKYARNCLPSHADVEAEVGGMGRLSSNDYFELSKELMFRMDGGPPRWFSPLELSGGSRSDNSPLLLYLPDVDGVGLGLLSHHQTLGEIFDVWCLHIPVTDRSSFTGLSLPKSNLVLYMSQNVQRLLNKPDLVKLVEKTVKSENSLSPNRPIYLVGESMGGCLALAVAAHNPEIDLVLILVNPATSFSNSQLQSLIPLAEAMPQQLHSSLPFVLSLMTGMSLRMVTATVQNGLPRGKNVGELVQGVLSLSSYVLELANLLPNDTLIWKLKMLRTAAAYANSRLHAVKAQTLVLSSEKDLFLPSGEEGKRLKHILPNCEIRKFEDSGHALLLEDGFDLLTIIKGASFYRRGKCLDYASDYMPPTASEFGKINEFTRFFDVAVNPVMVSTLEDGSLVRGLAGIPSEGPVLFVGYHMLLGWELAPLVTRMWIEKNIMMRGMAHPMMFKKMREGKLPDISSFDTLRILGAVPVSANNLYRLLANKSHVLLYPGGIREALHRKGEEYKLFWPEQSEFVRMAARFGAKIIPFGAVGEDDVSQMHLDYNDLMKIPYFKAEITQLNEEAVKLRSDINGEVANQAPHLPIMTPKLPGRFYYYFGKPIETEGRKNELRSREKAHEVYLEVKSSVEGCMEYLKEKRGADPYRGILPRLTYQVFNGFDSQVPTFDL